MALLLSGDWHLSANPRDEYRFDFVEKRLPKIIEKRGVELLVFLGDITENKDEHPAELVNRVVKVFHNLSKLCPIVCLRGNHDWYTEPGNAYFGFLARLSGISWVGSPTPLADLKNVPESVSKACKAILLPHSADFERDWGEINFKAYDYAFAHQSFAGAKSESGFSLPGDVPLSYFPGKLQIISGDIHRPQTVGQLTYCGSPYHVDFGDDFDARVLLLEGTKLTSIPCPGPQKRLLEIHTLEELDEHTLTYGDIVQVRMTIESYDEWPELKAGIEVWAKENQMILNQAKPIIKSAVSAKTKLESRSVKTDEELLAEYAKKRQLAEGYLSTGLKLL